MARVAEGYDIGKRVMDCNVRRVVIVAEGLEIASVHMEVIIYIFC